MDSIFSGFYESVYAAHKSVGGKDQRSLWLKSSTKSRTNFDTQEYLRQDASCCPSGKGDARFTFSNEKLKETKKDFSQGKI